MPDVRSPWFLFSQSLTRLLSSSLSLRRVFHIICVDSVSVLFVVHSCMSRNILFMCGFSSRETSNIRRLSRCLYSQVGVASSLPVFGRELVGNTLELL